MKEVLKVKGAGARSVRSENSPEDVLGTIEDGPIVFDGDHESTPPDIIVEK